MVEHILFVFEGEKTERILCESLLKHFIGDDESKRVVKSSFQTDIYALYKSLNEDDDLDVFALIKDKNLDLKAYNRDSFSQLYLFFDYDGHSNAASDDKILKLLNFFDEETENGKLFISYPMVESVKCIADLTKEEDFINLDYQIDRGSSFKNYVSDYSCRTLIHFGSYDRQKWNNIIRLHCIKGNFIIRSENIFPSQQITQRELFSSQKRNYIDAKRKISIIGSFPLLLLDFYGTSHLSTLVSGQVISNIQNPTN